MSNFGQPPLGPHRLAGFLRKHGHHVDVWDCNVSEVLRLPSLTGTEGKDRSAVLVGAFVEAMGKDHDLGSYQWIGFSILNDCLPLTLGVIYRIRQKCPNAFLVAGNHEATVNLQDCLGKSVLDGIVMADAERSMLRLMNGESPSTIPGVIWRNFQPKPTREEFEEYNDAIDWSSIPYEAYWERTRALYDLDAMSPEDRLEMEYRIHTVRIHSLVACELSCSYCSVRTTRRLASGNNKPSIVNLGVDALERNLIAIKDQVQGVMQIYDSCDEAFLGKGRAEEYADVLLRTKAHMDEGLPRGIRYLIQCRTNDLYEDIIVKLARAGVWHITIGVESPIERVRKTIVKPQDEELVRNVARWCHREGIVPYMLFIMFLPEITLEELRVACERWRLYQNLGAMISVEPFCMSYLGTDLNDSSDYLTEHVTYPVPYSGVPPRRLKWATLIWPRDPRVCAVLQWFRDRVDGFIEEEKRRLGTRHAYKGITGTATVTCLEHALAAWDRGEVPPWDPARSGRRSAVYQDYGDQESGAEVMIRATRTATRFNSTHAILDNSANTGILGWVKDPARPTDLKVL